MRLQNSRLFMLRLAYTCRRCGGGNGQVVAFGRRHRGDGLAVNQFRRPVVAVNICGIKRHDRHGIALIAAQAQDAPLFVFADHEKHMAAALARFDGDAAVSRFAIAVRLVMPQLVSPPGS